MYRKTLVFAFAALAVLCLSTLAVNSVQADDLSNPQPVINRSWGSIKTLYQPPTFTNVATQDSTSAAQIGKPGVSAFAGTIANQNWWRGLSQGTRNEAICQTAYNHMVSLGGGYNRFSSPSGYNCKTWVQMYVVPNASRGVATIPQSTSWCTWASGQYVQLAGYGPAGLSIRGAERGQIAQASWGNYPHTMIIWARDAYGVQVIDCNMDLRGGLEIHYITFNDFESRSGGCYRIYQVIGG